MHYDTLPAGGGPLISSQSPVFLAAVWVGRGHNVGAGEPSQDHPPGGFGGQQRLGVSRIMMREPTPATDAMARGRPDPDLGSRGDRTLGLDREIHSNPITG